MTKEVATVSIPGIYDESFDVPREHTRSWDPSHSLYLEVRRVSYFLAGFGGVIDCTYVRWHRRRGTLPTSPFLGVRGVSYIVVCTYVRTIPSKI